jgi:hypothetical protein
MKERAVSILCILEGGRRPAPRPAPMEGRSNLSNPVFPRRRGVAALLLPLFVAFAALAGVGCGSGGGTKANPTPTPTPGTGPGTGTGRVVEQPGWSVNTPTYEQNPKKWTFLVYINGANDLEEFGSLNMNQMEEIGSNDDINLVVQFKRFANRYDRSNGDWGDTRRFYVVRDSNANLVTTPPLSQHPNKDAGDWRVLREFITWGVTTYPAERYCLVVWNHGAGWRKVNFRSGTPTRGVSYDDITGNHIDTIELPQAITLDGILGNGRKWDVLAFDASLMQMIEVAHEVRDQALFITGSEESPPGEGYPYQLFLADLANNPNMSPRDFSIRIAQRTVESYGPNSNITQSALDASKIGDVTSALNDFGTALYNVRNTYRDNIVYARNTAENYDYPYYRDILDFTRLITDPLPGLSQPPVPDAAVQNAAVRVRNAVRAAVIWEGNGDFHPNSNGLSIFLPSPSQYNSLDIDQANGYGQRYTALQFAKDAPGWQNFIANGPR